jgi:hypothetical protein
MLDDQKQRNKYKKIKQKKKNLTRCIARARRKDHLQPEFRRFANCRGRHLTKLKEKVFNISLKKYIPSS